MSMSNYLEDLSLGVVYHGEAHTVPAQIWVALFTADPTDAGDGAEVPTEIAAAPSGYARQRVYRNVGEGSPYWAAKEDDGAGGRQVKNAADFEFPEFTDAVVAPITTTHWATFDASTGGNLLDHGALDTAQTFNAGSVPRFRAGQLKVQRR